MPKQTNYDLIIFDWDGTIANSAGIIVESVKAACISEGVALPSDYSISGIIGLGLEEAFTRLFPDMQKSSLISLQALYRDAYLRRMDEIVLFDGVDLGIKGLYNQGYALGIATGKSRRGLNNALNKSNLYSYFKVTKTMDECFSKPHPQMINEILESLMIENHRALMIGDSSYDMEMAANAKVDSIGVLYGAQTMTQLQLHNPLALIENAHDLFLWIAKNG